jgi:meso-butanediol dehydrogenase/(S,S)-butanediol dehydrogenase/diacetyl reductase
MRLSEKVALVTGGTAGIGANIVETMANEGAAVGFTGRNADRGKKLEVELVGKGLNVRFIQADSGVQAEVASAVQQTVDAFGSLTVLVNNAAATEMSVSGADNHVDEIENADWDEIVRAALYGTLWASKYAIPHMRAAGKGSIINISASSSKRSSRGRPAYQASKGAINSLTRQMAADYGAEGIRSNAIIVGFINSGGPVISKLIADEEYFGVIKSMLVLPYIGEPSDISYASVYLASDEAKYVTGTELTVDGGALCYQPIVPRWAPAGA